MSQGQRKQLWVNGTLQSAVLRRCFYYWAACLIFLTIPLLVGAIFADPSKLFYEHIGPLFQRHWPIYLCLCTLLPFLLSDALRFTNRIAGPIHRMRMQMNQLIDGGDAKTLQFREGDFWQELPAQFNQIADLLQERQPQSTK